MLIIIAMHFAVEYRHVCTYKFSIVFVLFSNIHILTVFYSKITSSKTCDQNTSIEISVC